VGDGASNTGDDEQEQAGQEDDTAAEPVREGTDDRLTGREANEEGPERALQQGWRGSQCPAGLREGRKADVDR